MSGRVNEEGVVAAGSGVVFEVFETSPCFAHHSGAYSAQEESQRQIRDKEMATIGNKADGVLLSSLVLRGVVVSGGIPW
jgi:hypothetical protein